MLSGGSAHRPKHNSLVSDPIRTFKGCMTIFIFQGTTSWLPFGHNTKTKQVITTPINIIAIRPFKIFQTQWSGTNTGTGVPYPNIPRPSPLQTTIDPLTSTETLLLASTR